MELNVKTIEELEARKAELAVEIDAEGADLDAIETEVRAIKEELEKRAAEEAKKVELRQAVAEGEGQTLKTNMEEPKMENRTFAVDSAEYRVAYLKLLQGKPLNEEERAGYTQSGTYATNAIPTQVADKFFEKMKKLAPMLSKITLFRVAGNLKFVSEGTRNAASKHTENAAQTAALDTTVSVTLGAFEFMKVIGISRSAQLMSIDAFEQWLVELLAGDIARAIDNYIINDTDHGFAGASCITYTNNTNQITGASTGYTLKNVMNLIALLPAAYDAEAEFLVNKATLYNDIACITDSSGRSIFVASMEEGMHGRIMGYPVVVDDYITTSNHALYLGKWSDIVGNLSQDVTVEADESAGFLSATKMYRGLACFDCSPAKQDAIVRLVRS